MAAEKQKVIDKSFELVTYKSQEACDILGISLRTLMRYVKDGQLHCTKVGRNLRFTKENLEHFLRNEPQE